MSNDRVTPGRAFTDTSIGDFTFNNRIGKSSIKSVESDRIEIASIIPPKGGLIPMTENKKQALRNNEHYGMQPTFDKLYTEIKMEKIFTDLMKYITTEENMILAYRNIKKNRGSNTLGTDGMTIRDIENWETERYVRKV